MEEQDRKEQWAQLLPDKNLQRDTYGRLTPNDVNAASEKDRDAYLNKYWPELEERMLVQSFLKGNNKICFFFLTLHSTNLFFLYQLLPLDKEDLVRNTFIFVLRR